MANTKFGYILAEKILKNIYNNYTDNTDFDRFGNANISPKDSDIDVRFAEYMPYFEDLEILYKILGDAKSKDTLIDVILFRILGNRKIKLPLNTPEYWQNRELVRSLCDKEDHISIKFMNWNLYKFDLHKTNFPIKLYSTAGGVHTRFMVKQYEYKNSVAIEAEKGNVVIDAGGCWGDTALYFAEKVGTDGKVYTFEFIPSNIEILEKNLNLNPDLKERITLIKNPLWNKSGDILYYSDNGPGSKVNDQKTPEQSITAPTISIDDFVKQNNLNKVDFIKMDIEGAELNALRGAINTITKFKPKLAISIYHNLEDFKSIPAFLSSLNVDYKFYLGHYTIHSEETVLFAKT